MQHSILPLLLVAVLGAVPVSARQSSKPEKQAKKTEKHDEEARQRRDEAMFLLFGLADDAARFADIRLRARVQARVADALWKTDRERAVALFRRAWESAEVAHEEDLRQEQDERRRQADESGSVVMIRHRDSDARDEVLRLAANRDRALSDAFLAKLAAAEKREADDAAHQLPEGPVATPDALRQRLRLAQTLLEAKNVAAAIEVALPGLSPVTTDGIQFLTGLRAQTPSDADRIYRDMLSRAGTDPTADANVVSVLGSYVLTPNLFIRIDAGGGTSSQTNGPRGSNALPPADVRSAFLQTAGQILLRPLSNEEVERTSAGREGTYFMIARLLPVFEKDAPYLVEQLRARQTALAIEHPERYDPERNELVRSGLEDDASSPGPFVISDESLASVVEQARKAEKGERRDGAYARAAVMAVSAGDARAREFADAIDDSTLRSSVRGYVDFVALQRALEDKDKAEATLELLRTSEIPEIQKVWALCSVAKSLAKTSKERAIEVLMDAAAHAREIDLDDADRARGLFGVAAGLIDVDPGRVIEYAGEATKAANRAPAFTGSDAQIDVVMRAPGMGMATSTSAESFDVETTFAFLARTDMPGAVLLAKSFAGETPRATALLVVGRTVLSTDGKLLDAPARTEPAR